MLLEETDPTSASTNTTNSFITPVNMSVNKKMKNKRKDAESTLRVSSSYLKWGFCRGYRLRYQPEK